MQNLETKRMRLRPLLKSDSANLMKIFSDPIAMEFYPGTKDEAQTNEWIKRFQNRYEEMRIGFLACELKKTGEFLGVCGLLFQPDVNGQDEIEVGYLFIRKFWGQGFATEAARAYMEYGFRKKGYKRIVSLIDPNNQRSIRVAEKNGLKKEFRTVYKERDCVVYSLEIN